MLIRPGAQDFLQALNDKYEIMAFTLGIEKYADKILSILDPNRQIFKFLLHRGHNVFNQDLLRPVKDVALIS